MRVDCYNATECPVSSLSYGDTFYFEGSLYLKVRAGNVLAPLLPPQQDDCFIVALDVGEVRVVDGSTQVIYADTKVVANTKEVQF